MSTTTTPVTPEIQAYMAGVAYREPAVLTQLRERTKGLSGAGMQVAPEQGAFLAMLVRLMDAARVLEIGTYTGYSSICMALALPPRGKITCLDRSEQWTAVAREFWDKAGVAGHVELRLGDALVELEKLIDVGCEGYYDIAFIDADKVRYKDYYERCLLLVRAGGLIAIDNTLWHGKVADPQVTDADTEALRAFNRFVHADDRVDLSLVSIGDGVTLARKKP